MFDKFSDSALVDFFVVCALIDRYNKQTNNNDKKRKRSLRCIDTL